MSNTHITPTHNYYQIIINKVPLKDGTTKTLSYSKHTSENYISYQEIYNFLESKTSIPKKYFILRYKGREITYIDTFIKYYSSSSYDNNSHIITNKEYEFMDVRLHINIDYHIYKFYKSCILSNLCETMYLDMLKFVDELYMSYTTSFMDIDDNVCYKSYMFLKNNELFNNLSSFKKFRIISHIEAIKKREHIFNSCAKL